jgi:1-acyl-sn-glycerol-3-phosphate acyltransferase
MLYLFKLAVIGMVTAPASLVIILVGLFDPYGKHVYGVSRFWTWMVLGIGGVSLKVHGLNHLDTKQQYVFMVNHQSNIDIPVLVQSLPAFQLRWIAKKELLWIPLFGWAMWAAKHIVVDRSARADALGVLKKARQQIARGISVVVFPEGTRSNDGRLLPFKRGGFLLAVKTKTPIVPVTINGSGRILPKGDWRIRRGEIEVTVGEPIGVENYRPGTVRGLAAKVQERVAKQLRPPTQTAEALCGQGEPVITARSPMEHRTL